jgi:hypothetical protein
MEQRYPAWPAAGGSAACVHGAILKGDESGSRASRWHRLVPDDWLPAGFQQVNLIAKIAYELRPEQD